MKKTNTPPTKATAPPKAPMSQSMVHRQLTGSDRGRHQQTDPNNSSDDESTYLQLPLLDTSVPPTLHDGRFLRRR
jgi:hypothetical protein